MNMTVPLHWSRMATSRRAVPTSEVAWTSWPQACITGCSIPVMSTWVTVGCIGESGVLFDRQPVDVGADQDQRAVAVSKHPDNAGAADPFGDLDPRCAKFVGEPFGGLEFPKRELRVAVEVDEEICEVGVVVVGDRLRQIIVRRKNRNAQNHHHRCQKHSFHWMSPSITHRAKLMITGTPHWLGGFYLAPDRTAIGWMRRGETRMRRSIALLLFLAFAAMAPTVRSAGTLVVANKSEATVSLVDTGTGEIRATLPTGNAPHEVACLAQRHARSGGQLRNARRTRIEPDGHRCGGGQGGQDHRPRGIHTSARHRLARQ